MVKYIQNNVHCSSYFPRQDNTECVNESAKAAGMTCRPRRQIGPKMTDQKLFNKTIPH